MSRLNKPTAPRWGSMGIYAYECYTCHSLTDPIHVSGGGSGKHHKDPQLANDVASLTSVDSAHDTAQLRVWASMVEGAAFGAKNGGKVGAVIGSVVGALLQTVGLCIYIFTGGVRWFSDLPAVVAITLTPMFAFSFATIACFFVVFYRER